MNLPSFSQRAPAPRLHPFFRLLICVLGCVAVQVIVMLIIKAALSVAASISDTDASTSLSSFFDQNFLLLNLLVYPPTLLCLWICRRFLDRRTFMSLGLRAQNFFKHTLAGWACGFLACALVFGILVLSGQARIIGLSLEAQRNNWSTSLITLLGWAAMMACVGFFEEICFRGYALHNLNNWLGARGAIAFQAVAFALVHLGNLAAQKTSTPDATLAAWLAMPNIFLFAVFCALCYFKTGSLWFPISFHAAWNFFLGCVFSFPVSGIPIFKLFDVQLSANTFLTGGSFGPEASVLLTPILIAQCIIIARAGDSPLALSDLNSLKFSAPDADGVLDISAIETEDDVARENRFKATMRPRTLELDGDTMATLRALNSERTARETTPRRENFAPLETLSAAASTPITPSAEAEEKSVEEKTVETHSEKPAPISIIKIIEAPPQTPKTSTPPREENASTLAPKKPAPRW